MDRAQVIVDAIFGKILRTSWLVTQLGLGFGFKGPARPPYDQVLHRLTTTGLPIVAVDVPSGWDVEQGPSGHNVNGEGNIHCYKPTVLVSLAAPKGFARHYQGVHYVGGRFMPPSLAKELSLSTIPYQGSSQILRLC